MKSKTLMMLVATTLLGCGSALAMDPGQAAGTQPAAPSNPTKERLVFQTAGQLAALIRSRQVSATDVVQAHLAQIEAHNPKINAVVTPNGEAALERARQADAALEKGELWGPLHGVPVTIKDNLAVQGIKTSSGHKPLADFVADQDATVVARLRAAGAIIIGITNMPALGLDGQTFNELHGQTNNPWDLAKAPGGSSGGCSAAVAAGFAPLSIGNDIGGSIRIPAAFAGVFGIKPTEHLVSKAGLLPESEKSRSLRHLVSSGPLARSAADLRLALAIIGGADNVDTDVPAIDLNTPEKKSPDNLKIGWAPSFGGVHITTEVQSVFDGFIHRLSAQGLNLEQKPLEIDYQHARQLFFDIFAQEALVHESFIDRLLMSSAPFQKVFPLSLPAYLKTMDQREKMIQQVEAFLETQDVWIIPAAPIAAHDHRKPDGTFGPFNDYKEPLKFEGHEIDVGSLTTLFNLTGHPVVVMPIGLTDQGMPVGVQLVGRRWKDMELLNVAEQLSELVAASRLPYEENMQRH